MADSTDSSFTCHICGKPIRLETDIYTDEEGKAVHQECYARKTTKKTNPSSPQMKARAVSDPVPQT
jgi:hypothetical protein